MIFYDCSTAPSPRRARIFLHEKQAEFETVQIDLGSQEQLGDAFKAINPSCTVPALKLDDGTVLTQNAGIASYLEAAYPSNPLMGRTPEEKGLVANWVAKIEIDGFQAVAEALRNSTPRMADRAITGEQNYAQIPELADRGLSRLVNFFDHFNEHLKGREFVTTDTFTNADIAAVVVVDFSRIVKVKPQPHHEALVAWRQRLDERPSVGV
ncbi:MAG: glutathione S-transferase family protein [Pseudomonadota bacterium]